MKRLLTIVCLGVAAMAGVGCERTIREAAAPAAPPAPAVGVTAAASHGPASAEAA
jgi:hypothetical protein